MEAPKPRVHISQDGLTATLNIPSPKDAGRDFSIEDLLLYLDVAGVEWGIDEDAIKSAISTEDYGREIVVAVGKEPTEGIDGSYEYHFSQDFSRSPMMREDGTADYRAMKTMELVEEGKLIATYTPAVPGDDGMAVTGKVIFAKKARELSPLRGRGFDRSEDGLTYTTNRAGKIVIEPDGKVMIYPVHEVFGDAGIDGGNIDFRGDVIVHGDVAEGISVHATGSIVIDGVAEDCRLSAGGDIIIKKGVKGAERTMIESQKRVISEFIELATVRCEGMVEADVFYNSDIFSSEKIFLTGKKASVIGGKMWAIEGIECQNVGNEFGVNTLVQVGMDVTAFQKMADLEDEVDKLNDELIRIEMSLKEYEAAEKNTGISYKGDPKRMQLLRSKLGVTGNKERSRVQLESLRDKYERGQQAEIIVHGVICPGTKLYVSELSHSVVTALKAVKYKRIMGEILATGLEEKDD